MDGSYEPNYKILLNQRLMSCNLHVIKCSSECHLTVRNTRTPKNQTSCTFFSNQLFLIENFTLKDFPACNVYLQSQGLLLLG